MKKVAVLITSHNRREKTVRCLKCLSEAIRACPSVRFDIFWVDDGSTDGSGAAVRSEFPDIQVIQGDGNLFWAGGMRKAWAAAAQFSYNGYLWLNDDTYVYPSALFVVAEALERFSDAIVVGTTDESGRPSYGAYRGYGFVLPDGTYQRLPEGCSWTGNFVFVPESVYAKLGNMGKAYRHGGADTDYAFRAKRSGVEVLIAPNYIGNCQRHQQVAKWCARGLTLIERWKAYSSPKGAPLREYLAYKRLTKGKRFIPIACLRWFYILLRTHVEVQMLGRSLDERFGIGSAQSD